MGGGGGWGGGSRKGRGRGRRAKWVRRRSPHYKRLLARTVTCATLRTGKVANFPLREKVSGVLAALGSELRFLAEGVCVWGGGGEGGRRFVFPPLPQRKGLAHKMPAQTGRGKDWMA